jgi:hypothetical protein
VALWLLLCEVSEHSKLVSEVTEEAMELKILETSWHSGLEWKDMCCVYYAQAVAGT